MLGKWCHNSTTSFSQTLDGPWCNLLGSKFLLSIDRKLFDFVVFFLVIVLGSKSQINVWDHALIQKLIEKKILLQCGEFIIDHSCKNIKIMRTCHIVHFCRCNIIHISKISPRAKWSYLSHGSKCEKKSVINVTITKHFFNTCSQRKINFVITQCVNYVYLGPTRKHWKP